MKNSGRNNKIRIFNFLVFMLLTVTLYNVYDNQRILVVKQEITVKRLPASFDGFRILLISDLHGKYFGKQQGRLIKTINALDYDMIAFAGDMNASTLIDDTVENSSAVLDFLDGIEKKEYIFWVDGNTGPNAIEDIAGAYTGELTTIGKILQNKGVKMLILPYAFKRGEDWIWITPEMSEINFDSSYRAMQTGSFARQDQVEKIQAFYQVAYAAFQETFGNGEMKIMLSHTPKQTNLSVEELEQYGANLDYDLILSGHYHGGQIRLPWIGALYIPSPTSGINNSGFFPDPDEVKGLNYYGTVPQYISAGLGASGHVQWASFRLFNTPEINLIILEQE